jgi:hypothetical protein
MEGGHVKAAMVASTKTKKGNINARKIAMLVLTLTLIKPLVMPVIWVNIKIKTTNLVANRIVLLAITLQMRKKRVLLVPRANTNLTPTKKVAKMIVLLVGPSTLLKPLVMPANLAFIKIKTTKPGAKHVRLVFTLTLLKPLVHHVVMGNTMICKDNLVAKTIATLAPISILIKARV